MPVRNVDLLQDRWHRDGRYPRGDRMDRRTQALIHAMLPPVDARPLRNPGGHSDRYVEDMRQRILAVIGDRAWSRHEIAARVGVSAKYIAKALAALVADGTLLRTPPAGRAIVRYWNPEAHHHDQQEAE